MQVWEHTNYFVSYALSLYLYIVDPRSLYDTKKFKLIYFHFGVWGLFLRSKGLCQGPPPPTGNHFVNSKAPHCWLLLLLLLLPLLLLLLCRLLGHWLHGENDSCECKHVCFPQSEKQPSLTHLPSSLTL